MVIPRANHSVSRSDISENALKVLYRLHKGGYAAFLVGGGVRDLSLRHSPKDFDVATDAKPEEIRRLFRNCRLIGRRFRLAHIHFGREIIEVATFRGQGDAQQNDNKHARSHHGLILRDNIYGTLEEDAWRRDFTINALYYNIADYSIVDYTGGAEDLHNKVIRIIGDAEKRYQEDPVRMLRAIRFAAKHSFDIEAATQKPIKKLGKLLQHVPPARLFDEILKLFHSGSGEATFKLLFEHDLLRYLFPATDKCIHQDGDTSQQLIITTLHNTDARINEGKPVTPAFLFAALLWHTLQEKTKQVEKEGLPPLPAFESAMSQVIQEQCKHISIPKRFSKTMREIWLLQYRLPKRYGKRPFRVLEHPRFRAGYDFMLLRGEIGEVSTELCDWWTEFQKVNSEEREAMLGQLEQKRRRRSRKSR